MRQQALEVVAQAEALAPEIAALRTRADALDAESAALLADIEDWQPEEDKLPGWAKADEATTLRRDAERRDMRHEQGLAGALRIDPTLPDAHAALAARHRAVLAAAEEARDTDAARPGRRRRAAGIREHRSSAARPRPGAGADGRGVAQNFIYDQR